MLMAPDDKVQEASKVALSDVVLGVLRVWHSVLVQHKDIEPICVGDGLTCGGSDPA